MKIGTFLPLNLHVSVRVYVEYIMRELKAHGVDFICFNKDGPLPDDVDILWDPGAGRRSPRRYIISTKKPYIATFHGAVHVSMPLRDALPPGMKALFRGYKNKIRTIWEWQRFRGRCSNIITVSKYAKYEMVKYLGYNEKKIVPIYHGVDHTIFNSIHEVKSKVPYLLHISSYQPKKNLKRILAAYQSLNRVNNIRFIVVAPGYPLENKNVGVKLIRSKLSHAKIAELYRGAEGFVFPSLHETFGMPILEAMASGCPVITSTTTACSEIADKAALLVNPYSVEEIALAMRSVVIDKKLRDTLKVKGIKRASEFTWRKSAEEHLSVFKNALEKKL